MTLKKIVFTYPAEVDIPESGCKTFYVDINAEAAGVVGWDLGVWIPNAKQTKSKRFLDAVYTSGKNINDSSFAQTSLVEYVEIPKLKMTIGLEVCRETKSTTKMVNTIFAVSPGTYQILFTDNLLYYNQNNMGLEYVLGDITFSDSKAKAEARAAATTDGTNKSQVKPNSSNSTQSAVSNRDSFQACEEINYEVEVLLAQAEEFNKKIEAFKRQFGKSLRKFVFYDAFHPLESVMCSSDVKEYNNQARNLVLGNAQEELKFLEQKYEEVSSLYKTISCIKGKVTKQIKGMNPKCPKGYKKK